MFTLHFRKDGSMRGGAGMDLQVVVFQTSLDKPLFGCVWSCLGRREDKLTSNYISARVLVVLRTLRAMILFYYNPLVVFPKIHGADSCA